VGRAHRLVLVLAAVVALVVGYWTLWGTARPAKQTAEVATQEPARRLPSDPETVAATTAPTITAPALPAVAKSTPPPIPPHIGHDHPLRKPEFRQDVLRSIHRQKEQIYAGLHKPWLDSLGLDEQRRSELVQILIDYEVAVNDFAMPYYQGRPLGQMPNVQVVAQKRADLISDLEKKFGPEVASRYRTQFPGPELER
jgi:hypothetical protein